MDLECWHAGTIHVGMQNCKLYGKNEIELNELMSVVNRFSSDIGMEFGFEKCAMVVLKADARVEFNWVVVTCTL